MILIVKQFLTAILELLAPNFSSIFVQNLSYNHGLQQKGHKMAQ